MHKALLASIAVLSCLSLAILWLTDIPLGVPGEWVWKRIDYHDAIATALPGLIQTGIVGAVYVAVVWFGLRRVPHCRRLELAAWLGGLAVVGFGWLIAVQDGTRFEYRLTKAPFVLYYPSSSGYFHTARYDVDSVPQLLQSYEERMEQGDVLHEGTHPPGLCVLYRSLIVLTDTAPGLNSFAAATLPYSFREALDTIDFAKQASGNANVELLDAADHTVLWLATLLTIVSAAATVVPMFVLIGQTESRAAAWRVVALWPLVPAIAVFVPKSDVLFLFPAALLVMTWMLAVRRQSAWLGILAGLIGWCCLFLSLVFLPVGLAAFFAGWFSAVPEERPALRAGLVQAMWRIAVPTAAGAVAVVSATVLFSALAELNLLRIWWLNIQNHAGFYEQYLRTVWLWLLINPLELALAAGVPIACLAAASVVRGLRHRDAGRPITVAVMLVWGLLWISGRNSGEVARLWIPLLPLLLWAAAAGLRISETDNEDRLKWPWVAVLIAQMLVCTATVMRVGGFHFSGITE